jgi:hypothetical protein
MLIECLVHQPTASDASQHSPCSGVTPLAFPGNPYRTGRAAGVLCPPLARAFFHWCHHRRCQQLSELQDRYQVANGSVVLMNPGEVHACNPIANQAWSYHMLYVDTAWLAQLQVELGLSANQDFHCFLRG